MSPVSSLEDFLKQSYDYIICGGGTAGLVIAARLTEDPAITVGVIEAGKSKLDDFMVDTPAMCLQLLSNPEYDWIYKTVPQKGNHNQIHHVPRGKVLGGSSATNFMVYVRGQSQDYDNWAAITGDPSWSSTEMKRYMEKHQKLEPLSDEMADRTYHPFVARNHGSDGPIRTSHNTSNLPIEDAILRAGEEVTGITDRPVDPWSGDHVGFYHGQATVARTGPNKGKRSYTARDYYLPVSHRSNLNVLTEAVVSRVIIEDKTATGVEFITQGMTHVVQAIREVIITGGVIGSPQILELSGIGDPVVLQRAGVKCLVELPGVGNDMQDHAMTVVIQQLAPGYFSADSMRFPEVLQAAQKELMEGQSGPLTNGALACGYFPAKLFLEDSELEEISRILQTGPHESDFQRKQFEQLNNILTSDKSASFQLTLTPVTANTEAVHNQANMLAAVPADAPDGVLICCNLQYCASRGEVHIVSSDPNVHPQIDPRYLSSEVDVILRSAAFKFIDKIINSKSLQGMLGKRTWPEEGVDLSRKDERRKLAREALLGQYHLCGSCAMGHTVNSRLKVFGAERLRVADCSVFPGHVSGNIIGTVYALAEKAADIIKEDWQ